MPLVERHCACGGSMFASSSDGSAAEEMGRLFDELHSGDGHRPASELPVAGTVLRHEAIVTGSDGQRRDGYVDQATGEVVTAGPEYLVGGEE